MCCADNSRIIFWQILIHKDCLVRGAATMLFQSKFDQFSYEEINAFVRVLIEKHRFWDILFEPVKGLQHFSRMQLTHAAPYHNISDPDSFIGCLRGLLLLDNSYLIFSKVLMLDLGQIRTVEAKFVWNILHYKTLDTSQQHLIEEAPINEVLP